MTGFETLYAQYYEQIYCFCYRFLRCRESAKEVTQEAFIKLYERMGQQGSEVQNSRAWLYKVAGNLSMNLKKKNGRRESINASLYENAGASASPEEVLIHHENLERIKEIIDQLKPRDKFLILLYQEEMSYREMSVATGMPVNSVGKTLWRIIDKIAETLKNENDA
jgi:RNA polymerase sigma-70 factor (ECF subfamily)